MNPAGAVLDVRGLRVDLIGDDGLLPVVRDVSFAIARGEILGVVGESGGGKSMIGAALTGLVEPPLVVEAGAITCDGRRIDGLPPDALRRVRGREIATIFQDPLTALNPVFTIGRQLVETIEAHTALRGRAARSEAVALLARVGIPAPEGRLASYPHEFSGGMRQRVVIALALAGRPKLLIADEPTTALDVSIQGQVIALLRDLCAERGMAILLITHDMGVIAEVAHRVAVLYAGRIVEIGPVADVIRRPRHPYTRGLMGSIPTVGRRLARLPQIAGAMPRIGALPPGCSFSPRCPQAVPVCAASEPALGPPGPHGASPQEAFPHEAACWLAAGAPA